VISLDPKEPGSFGRFFWEKPEKTRFFLWGSFCGVLLAKPLAGFHDSLGRIWWPEATRLEDPLDISNGTWTPKSSGERDGILNLV
jgi:hypothetical protein